MELYINYWDSGHFFPNSQKPNKIVKTHDSWPHDNCGTKIKWSSGKEILEMYDHEW